MRIEIGPRDVQNKQVVLVRRDTAEKITLGIDNLRVQVENTLVDIQNNLFKKAKERTEANTFTVDSYDEYKERIDGGGFFRVFLDHTNPEVEQQLKEETKSTVRCIPFDAPEEEGPCMITGKPCKYRVIAGQAY